MKQIVLICVFIAVGFGASVPTKSSFDSKIAYAVFNAQDVLTITSEVPYRPLCRTEVSQIPQ